MWHNFDSIDLYELLTERQINSLCVNSSSQEDNAAETVHLLFYPVQTKNVLMLTFVRFELFSPFNC